MKTTLIILFTFFLFSRSNAQVISTSINFYGNTKWGNTDCNFNFVEGSIYITDTNNYKRSCLVYDTTIKMTKLLITNRGFKTIQIMDKDSAFKIINIYIKRKMKCLKR